VRSVRGDYDGAISDYTRAAVVAEDNTSKATASYDIASAYLMKGDLNKALEEYQVVTSQYAQEKIASSASFQVGYCLMQQGERDKPIDHFEKVSLAYPDLAQADLLLFFTGQWYIGLGKPELAKLPLQQLTANYPNSTLKVAAEKMLNDLQDQETSKQGTSKQGPLK
jgi:TolA-binding protein